MIRVFISNFHIFNPMDVSFIEKKKGVLELEFDNKTLPNALAGALTDMGVDAYVYEPHPLKVGFRLHLEAADAMKELKSAVDSVEKDWKALGKLVKKAI